MLDDFRLRVFEKVCITLSFTLAARELGVSQPAISQNIAELEGALGVKLFERKGGRVLLTSQGKVFREYSEQILHWYDAANLAFSNTNPKPMELTLDSGKVIKIWSWADDIHLKLKSD